MEFQPGNYSVKFREFLLRQMLHGDCSARDNKQLQYCEAALRSAVHFGLPDDGVILPRGGSGIGDLRDIVKPPYPVTVLEFSANECRGEGKNVSSKRIVMAAQTEFNGEPATVLLFAAFIDAIGAWTLPIHGIILPQSADLIAGVTAEGEMCVCPIDSMPDAAKLHRHFGHYASMTDDEYNKAILDENYYEVQAYLDFVQALACQNVRTETIAAPLKLNKARVAAGKPKLFDYKILTLTPSKAEAQKSGGIGLSGRSPRAHLRRGHIRRLQSGKRTWVNATFVRGNGEGFVHKSYQVAPH